MNNDDITKAIEWVEDKEKFLSECVGDEQYISGLRAQLPMVYTIKEALYAVRSLSREDDEARDIYIPDMNQAINILHSATEMNPDRTYTHTKEEVLDKLYSAISVLVLRPDQRDPR